MANQCSNNSECIIGLRGLEETGVSFLTEAHKGNKGLRSPGLLSFSYAGAGA